MALAWHVAQRRACAALSVLAIASGARGAERFSLERGLGPPGSTAAAVHPAWPNVVFDGELYWVSYLSGLEAPPFGGALLALRVTEDGDVLDPNGLLVTKYAEGPTQALSAAPWGALAAYLGQNVLLTVRFGRDGGNADPTPRAFGTNVNAYPYPAAACLEQSCLLVWSSATEPGHSATETYALALDGCGEPASDSESQLPFGYWKPYPARDGYVLLGSTAAPASQVPLQALGVDALGHTQWGPVTLPFTSEVPRAFAQGAREAVLAWFDPMTKTLSTLELGGGGALGTTRQFPGVAPDTAYFGDMIREGDGFRLGLKLASSSAVLLLDATGQPIADPVTVAVDDACTPGAPMLASGTRSAFATWSWADGSSPCVDEPPSSVLARGPASEAALSAVRTTGHAARMGAPAFASDGAGYLAAWFEERAGATGLYTQALDRSGVAREPSVLTIPAPLARTHLRPAFVSFQAGRYLVELGQDPSTHDDSEPNQVAEVDAMTLARGTPRLQAKLGVPGLTSLISAKPIITHQGEDAPTLYRLTVEVTDRTGRTLGSSWMRDTPFGSTELSPVAAFDGERFTVVWSYYDDYETSRQPELLLMQFDEAGTALFDEPLVLAGLGDFAPRALVWGGGSLLLVLAPADAYSTDAPLSTVRLDRSGALLDPTPREFSSPPTGVQQRLLGTVFDGSAFVLALGYQNGDIHGVWLDTDGALLAEGAVTSSLEPEYGGALASAGDGHALLGYAHFDRDPSYLSTHAFVRVLGNDGECTTDNACDTTICNDCCTRGCVPAAAPLSCTVANCDAGCPTGTHCVSGLVCSPDPPPPNSKLHYTKGCGCRLGTTGDTDRGSLFVLGLLVLLAQRRRGASSPARRRLSVIL